MADSAVLNILKVREAKRLFGHISNPALDIYDGITQQYLGQATFATTPELEKALLDLVNHAIAPVSLVVEFAKFTDPTGTYVPPGLYTKSPRIGKLSADFEDSASGMTIPVEIRFTYDSLIRSLYYSDYYTGCAELSNIKVLDMRPVM